MVYVIAVHMSEPGTHHEHIESVRRENPHTSEAGESSRAAMVEMIDGGEVVRVRDDSGHDVEVRVVRPEHSDPYIRSFADGVVTDNLLELPKY